MNKNAIKNYAVWARTELMKQVAQKAYEYNVTETSLPDYNTDNVNGRLLSGDEKKQLNELITEVKKNGYDHVVEEVAYTWFNRFISLRYMEVNNYLPQRIRVFTNDSNEFKPDLLTDAIHVELDGLDKQKVFDYIEENKQEELYKYLLLTLCNDMNQYLPDMFTSIKDYKTLLFPDNLLKEDSVLAKLITDIDEDSWTDQVQIIGWLYQYYNQELFDSIYDGNMSKRNVEKDMLPAATGLFTPDWVVKTMTENALGKLWIDGHPNFDHSDWKYYLEEAEQEPEVIEQLKKIKAEHAKLKPEDIKVIDPCMGSGHILVYAFDVLMDIYRDAGYSDRDAAKSILENNLYGLEIDERAYHLAYFALMMKARSYNRRILNKETKFNLLEIREPIASLKPEFEQYLGKYTDLSHYLVNVFEDAKEFGSILNLDCTAEQLDNLKTHLDELKEEAINKDLVTQSEVCELNDLLKPLIKQARLLVQKYDVVITNPPYLGSGRYTKTLSNYIQKNHQIAKQDLSTVIFKNIINSFCKDNGYVSLISTVSWMFIQRFEEFRKYVFKYMSLTSIIDYGTELFDGKIGHLPIASYSFIKVPNLKHNFKTIRLTDYCYSDKNKKRNEYFNPKNTYLTNQSVFMQIPGEPIAYWCSRKVANLFSNNKLTDYAKGRAGIVTGNDPYFVRLWYEVNYQDFSKIGSKVYRKYHIMQKGGDSRYFYGNNDYVIKLKDLYDDSKVNKSVRRGDKNLYFHKAIGWSQVGSNQNKSFRYIIDSVCGTATPTIYMNNDDLYYYCLAFLNTNITKLMIDMLNPTVNLLTSDILNLPFIINNKYISSINLLVVDSIKYYKDDWDSFETSWDFKVHPLVKNHVNTINEAYNLCSDECESRFNTLKSNEEELNRIFIDIYGLQDELDPYVEDKDVTVRKADLNRDIKSFISYAVGCMFGRYSLDVEGLAYAGGEWDSSKYSTFIPDADDIIPICDEEYFEDDIVTRFVEFVRAVYGSDTLEDNLSFIANALGGKGAPRDVLRNYFLNDFFKDHCNTYQVTGSGKRPIYWLFDSGKKNGFKALVYIHRYAPDLIARMRTGYIHPQQARYRTQVELLQSQVDEATSTSERVKLSKQLKKINEQLLELNKYEEVVHHWADKMEPMDMDDGVKVNYAKFQELLAKIK